MSKLQDVNGDGYIGKPKFFGKIGAMTGLIVALGTITTSVVSLVRTINPPSEQKVDIAYELIKQKLEFIESSVNRNREDLKEFRSLVVDSIKHQENLENEKFKELIENIVEERESSRNRPSSPRSRIPSSTNNIVKKFEENEAAEKLELLNIEDEDMTTKQMYLPKNLDEAMKK